MSTFQPRVSLDPATVSLFRLPLANSGQDYNLIELQGYQDKQDAVLCACRDTSDLVPAVQHRHFQSPHLLTYMIQHYAPTKSSRPPLCLSERSALKLRPSLIGFEVHRLASALYPLSKYAKPRPGPFHPSGLRTPRKGRERKKNGKIRNRNKLPF